MANDENEVWKVVNDVIKPKKENEWMLKEEEKEIKDEQIIADTFNKFFIDKIDALKANIDQEYIEDPLERLEAKLKKKNLVFKLKKIRKKELMLIAKKLNKKRVLELTVSAKNSLSSESQLWCLP